METAWATFLDFVKIMLLLLLPFGVTAAIVRGLRWTGSRIRRRFGWEPKVKPPHIVWLNEAFVGIAGSILLPPLLLFLFHRFAAWLWPQAPLALWRATMWLVFPVALASIGLWFWGVRQLERFHRSKKEFADDPRAVICWFLAAVWLFLCVPYGFWTLFGLALADF